ncbi:MAG: efflux RND transporter permease subunit [Bacteroidetes bacterium]|nr:efflux RND transporter permease subunit [Bacteroidota bacterium]
MEDKSNKGFALSTLSVNNRKFVFLLTILIFFGGLIAYNGMPKENFPEIQIPEIYIGIAKPGASPEYMSKKITESIEKELGGIKLVDEINSNSVHGYATIRVKFDFKMPVIEALQKVKDAVDKARTKSDFPELPVEPNIFEMDPAAMPILNVNLRGNNASLLKDVAEVLEKKIEELPEISEVDIRGVQEQEMRIDVDPIKSQAVNVSLDDIQNAVRAENQNIPSGEILMDGSRKTLRIDGEFENAAQLKRLIVKDDDYLPVHLEDIAKVYFGNSDTTSFAREFGDPVVMLDIKKQGGENLLVASEKIYEILEESKNNGVIPRSVSISTTNDQSNNTRDMVSNLENSILLGVLLVVGVLLFFLGLRNALFVGVAIPLSMLMSFLILDAMSVSLNVMVLFSLVLALGMLVDNGIVIVENIYRNLSNGMKQKDAVVNGVGEVAWPIIASTATTLAAFIPLAFWPGIMGEFMKYLPITLIIVLGSSLFVALVINPVLAVAYMRIEENAPRKNKVMRIALGLTIGGTLMLVFGAMTLGNFLIIMAIFSILNLYVFYPGAYKFQNNVLPRLEDAYSRFLTKALSGKNPRKILFGTIGLFLFSIALMVAFPPKVDFFPVNEPNYVNIFIAHPIGTDILTTNETVLQVEKEVNTILKPYLLKDQQFPKGDERRLIRSIISQVGEGTSDPGEGPTMGNTPHKGRLTINFTEFQFREGIKTGQLLALIQEELKGKFTADIEISAEKEANGPPQGSPINIEVSGRGSYAELIQEAEKLKLKLARSGVLGIDRLKLNVESNRPEIPIVVDRDQVRKLNASTQQVGMAIRKALLGEDVSTYSLNEESYDLVLRFEKSSRESLDALLDQNLIFRNNKGVLIKIPIRSVVKKPMEESSFTAVIRKDQLPMVVISSGVQEGFNGNEVVEELKTKLEELEKKGELNESLTYAFTGQQEEQAKEMAFLSSALMIAVFMITLIIVAQFNSYSAPTVIMLTVVLSLIGVLLGLVISRQNFVIMMTMIGIISLAGVVVNNAIVLIDFTNMLRKQRREELDLNEDEQLPYEEIVKSAIEAGKTRLRPVLLTAITTILGLIPLAVGFNIDFFSFLSSYDANIYIGGDNNIFFSPMSWAIIYGLTFATFLTLVVIPSLYVMTVKIKASVYKKMGWKIISNI